MNLSVVSHSVTVHPLRKKSATGFGDLKHPYDESRRSPADSAASLSVPPVLVARWEARKGLPVPARGVRFANPSSHRPRLATGAVVFANHTPRRPFMANLKAAACAVQPTPAQLAATRVIDAIDDIECRLLAFEAIEQLVSLHKAGSREDLAEVNRTSLGWLMNIVNVDLRQTIVAARAQAKQSAQLGGVQ